MGDEILNFQRIGGLIALASLAGMALLLPLYLSQRRDIRRLREWMERVPDHPRRDYAASEARLDRAEAELEEIYGVPAAPAEAEAPEGEEAALGEPGATPTTPLPAAVRVTGERPALERITMERAALQPHPRWQRFLARVGEPRWLAAIAIGALAIAFAGIVVSERVLEDGEQTGAPGPAGLDPSAIEVAVLNATTSGGVAGALATRIERAGFTRGEVGSIEGPREQSVVMYEPLRKAAATLVGRKLRIKPRQRISRQAQKLAGGADVVVIVGEDRAEG